MLWIVMEEESLQITGCNMFNKDGSYQIWVEKPNGKTKLIDQSSNIEDILVVKEAIDYAIKHGHRSLELAS